MKERRTRDKEKTIHDILTAARRLFSEKGLHGTSIRDIEQASGVSKGLILHHFESKEKLYAAVQDELMKDYVNFLASQRDRASNLKEALYTTIQSSLEHSRRHQEHRRITLWSYLEGQDRSTELDKRFTLALVETMRAGQKAGIVRDDIDPFFIPFIIKGAIDNWIQKETLLETLAEHNQPLPPSDKVLAAALAKLFLK
jgi:AcrR family transcriptional regulator